MAVETEIAVSERIARLRAELGEALQALTSGEAAEAERRAKAVSALVRAERDVAELEMRPEDDTEQDDEARRAELRRRLALYAEADRADAPLEVLERIALTGSAE